MDPSEIIDALTALAGELERRGVVAEMYVVMPSRDSWKGTIRRRRLSSIYGDRLNPAARFFVEQVFSAEVAF